MQIVTVEKGHIITTEGAQEDTIFILIEGEVEISKQLVILSSGDARIGITNCFEISN